MRELAHNSPRLSKEQAYFANLNLDLRAIRSELSPIIEMICYRIECTYRSPAKITFTGANAQLSNNILSCMQFDDICLKLWHIHSGHSFFLTLSARLARTLLIRLLATSLIDDSNSLPFSSTEKGIFSFVVARLLFDLKSALNDKMPDLKLMGIYHIHDDALNAANVEGFGIYTFSFGFAAEFYPVTIIVPKELFTIYKRPKTPPANLLIRCSHIRRPLVIHLVRLNMTQKALTALTFGDFLLFDRCNSRLLQNGLCGPIRAHWQNIAVLGHLSSVDRIYRFSLTNHHFFQTEDEPMEELEVAYAKDQETIDFNDRTDNKLADLAKNIRVALSVEVSRLPMTLREICQLREGEVIDLGRKIDDPLEMWVENKVIGYCQPIQIDGRLGIRILRIEGTNAQDAKHS
ncbi:MAG TPA: FliM/FliN family flagellar motor switch protein [Myxococcota bacterium]|nr:FliM/FliN family flagellar motor switch protein [Myxococcota bacterium]